MLENIDPNSLLVEDQYIFAQVTKHIIIGCNKSRETLQDCSSGTVKLIC